MACCILQFIGRVFFVAIFILAGVEKLQTPSNSAGFLVARMEMLEGLVSQKFNVTLPAPYKTSEFKPHADNFIKGVGVYLIVAGAGTMFAYKCANCLIGLFVFLTVVIVHNPFYTFKDDAVQKGECIQFILNMALWGISMVMCGTCGSSTTCTKKAKKSQKVSDAADSSTTSGSQNAKGGKGKKKAKRE